MKKLLIYLSAALLMAALLSGPAAANTDADSNANGCVQVTDQVEGFFNGIYATGPLVDPVWGGGYANGTLDMRTGDLRLSLHGLLCRAG